MPEIPDEEEVIDLDAPYRESEDFVPSPTDQFGTYDTSGTAGTAHSRIEEVTPVFDVAKKQDLITAAKALDPEDDSVSSSLVILPDTPVVTQGDPEAARKRVENAAAAAAKEPVIIGGKTLAQEEAAESGEKAAVKATAQTGEQGVGAPVSGDPDRLDEATKTAKGGKASK